MSSAAGTVVVTSKQVAGDVFAYKSEQAKQAFEEDLKKSNAEEWANYSKLDSNGKAGYLRNASQGYRDALKWGTGGEYSRALDAVTAAIVGSVAGQGGSQVVSNALAPYAAALIGDRFDTNHGKDPDAVLQLLSHAVLGALVAEANGGSAGNGAPAAAGGEIAAQYIADYLYPAGLSNLTEQEKQTVLALSQAVGALAGGLGRAGLNDASLGAFVAGNAVENNRLLHTAEINAISNYSVDFAKFLYRTDEPTDAQIIEAARRLTERALFQTDSAMASSAAASDDVAGGFLLGLKGRLSDNEMNYGGGEMFDARGTQSFGNHAINSEYLINGLGLYSLAKTGSYPGLSEGFSLPYYAYANAANDASWMGATRTYDDALALLKVGAILKMLPASPQDTLSIGSSNWGLVQSIYHSGKSKPGTEGFNALLEQMIVDAVSSPAGLGDSGMQSISRGGLKGIPGSGEGVGTLHPVAGKFTNRQLQDAVDALHAVLGSPSVRARKVTTVSVTPDGKVIISNNNSVPSIAQQKLAREIFGDSVIFVRGTTRTNAPGEKGNHAERRGMQAVENPAGTVQASSHYACGSCEGAQAEAGVRNATGAASQNGGKVTRPINPPETPSRLHPRPRKRTSE